MLVTAEELLELAVSASSEVGHMFDFCCTADEEPGVLVATFLNGTPPKPDIFIGRQCGALGTRVSWSPDEGPTKRCWAIVAVATGEPAATAVGPYDGLWYRLDPIDLPWFLASTAGGIRASIEKGEPLVPKHAADPQLFDRVANMKPPKTDRHGRI